MSPAFNSFAARIRSGLLAVLRAARLRSEVAEEHRFHVDAYVDDLVRLGIPPAEAQRRAHAELGPVMLQQERFREAFGLRLFYEIGGDLRFGLRSLRKNSVFSVVAILSLALGIGATTAMFSLIYAVL